MFKYTVNESSFAKGEEFINFIYTIYKNVLKSFLSA